MNWYEIYDKEILYNIASNLGDLNQLLTIIYKLNQANYDNGYASGYDTGYTDGSNHIAYKGN